MTYYGGANEGNIFSIDTNGMAYKNLFNFGGLNGTYPEGSLTISGKVLYGMASGGGAHTYGLFSLSIPMAAYTKTYMILVEVLMVQALMAI